MNATFEQEHDRLVARAKWLVRLRWVAVAGQLGTIAVTWLLAIPVPLVWLGIVIGLTGATNIWFAQWLRGRSGQTVATASGNRVLAAMMVLDLAALTALLGFTGGTSNPFTVFFFVNLSLAAVMLPPRWVWMLTALAIVCLILVTIWHVPLPQLDRAILVSSSAERATVRLADVGAMVALVTCGSVVVYFITRIMHELRERDRRLRIAEQQQQLSRQLESLGTLSAGAAHELATPLSTIALVAKELGIQLNKQSVSQSVLDDIQLVRSEVDHCRSILNRMSGRAGQAVGEELTELTVRQLIETVVSELRQPERVHLRLPFRDEQRSVTLPLQTVAQAVRGVIQNGLDASTEDQKVDVSVQCNDHLHLEIRDHGRGMPAEVLQRAGEPFFTTKQPGNGMGLGLFLTRSVFERLGGSCRIRSIPDQGTTVDLELPFAP